ncbi:hypothetical protein [Actinomadura sp. 9N215]|uniref:hypothetical protein n=1 Tax=Actinomadura sp. 9N215 TaxID=3375150 RepID=UPI0037A70C56
MEAVAGVVAEAVRDLGVVGGQFVADAPVLVRFQEERGLRGRKGVQDGDAQMRRRVALVDPDAAPGGDAEPALALGGRPGRQGLRKSSQYKACTRSAVVREITRAASR